MITLNIRELLRSEAGTTTKYKVELPPFDDAEFHLSPSQKIELKGYSMGDGVVLIPITNKLHGKATCTSCLKEFELDANVYPTEKQYYIDIPEDIEEELVGQIDKKSLEVDIEDLIREAVFLALPSPMRCSPDCHSQHREGDLPDTPTSQKPFANLKDLLK